MRIGMDYRAALGGRGGIPVYVRRLADALARTRADDRVLLFARRFAPGTPVGPVPPNTEVFDARVPSRATEVLARFGRGPDRVGGGCDVFHQPDYAWVPGLRAPLVATVHDVLFLEVPACYPRDMRKGLTLATRRLVRGAARLVVPSARTKIGLVERLGADPSRVDVVPLAPRALPEPTERERALVPDRPYVLAVGTLEPRKNLVRLAQAHRVALARGLDADLLVVGAPGWTCGPVEAALAGAPRVRRLGAVGDGALHALYRGARALAYPSLGEGFGLPIVEAGALGVPVLTSAGTGCAETAAGAALCVDPYDVDALADGLARVVAEGAERRALVARGRARAADLSWEATATATRATYVRAARAAA